MIPMSPNLGLPWSRFRENKLKVNQGTHLTKRVPNPHKSCLSPLSRFRSAPQSLSGLKPAAAGREVKSKVCMHNIGVVFHQIMSNKQLREVFVEMLKAETSEPEISPALSLSGIPSTGKDRHQAVTPSEYTMAERPLYDLVLKLLGPK